MSSSTARNPSHVSTAAGQTTSKQAPVEAAVVAAAAVAAGVVAGEAASERVTTSSPLGATVRATVGDAGATAWCSMCLTTAGARAHVGAAGVGMTAGGKPRIGMGRGTGGGRGARTTGMCGRPTTGSGGGVVVGVGMVIETGGAERTCQSCEVFLTVCNDKLFPCDGDISYSTYRRNVKQTRKERKGEQ